MSKGTSSSMAKGRVFSTWALSVKGKEKALAQHRQGADVIEPGLDGRGEAGGVEGGDVVYEKMFSNFLLNSHCWKKNYCSLQILRFHCLYHFLVMK